MTRLSRFGTPRSVDPRPLFIGGHVAASLKRPDVLLGLFIALGLLGSPLYNTALVRSQLIGAAAVGPHGSVAVLCAGLALAWRATLRRSHVWADPGALTWSDFDDGYSGRLGRRLPVDRAARVATAAPVGDRRENALHRGLLAGWAARLTTVPDRRENMPPRRLLAGWTTRFTTAASADSRRESTPTRRLLARWATRFTTVPSIDDRRSRTRRLLTGRTARVATAAPDNDRPENMPPRRLLAGWTTRFTTAASADGRRQGALHSRLLARWTTRFTTVPSVDDRSESTPPRRLFAGWTTRFATVAYSDGGRSRVLRQRLLAGWAVRFATVAYFFIVAGVLIGFPPDVVGPLALSVAVAALALVMARRRPVFGEAVLPLVPAVLGVFPDTPLWIFAAVAAAAALLLAWSPPLSPTRDTLVRHFRERLVRRTSAAFLDVWALLPTGRPVHWRRALDGRFIVTRYVVTGTLARRHALGLPVFLALAVTAAHTTFPGVTSVWLLGLGSYLALLPFAAPIAQLHRVPGLRRWLDASELRLLLVMASVLVALAACWTAVVALLGVPVTLGSLVAVVAAAYSVVRTVTRGPLEFSSMGLVLYEGVLIPTGLLRQLARGPDLLIIGLLLCGLLP
ncbi:hypothetical protein AB0878_14955 [Amycolatopsis sp. NPDC047767]|uniref:hypothetical protein n=1 Tax=Amycolatopsis sp. NPDC047767 TaxID=3156765 RepID=UPI0034529EEF